VEATVIAGTAAWADIWTKAVIVQGVEATFAHLDTLDVAACAVDADGTVEANKTWELFATQKGVANRWQ
jgi:hypothetical protein